MSYNRPPYDHANASWEETQGYTRPACNAADAAWAPSGPEPLPVATLTLTLTPPYAATGDYSLLPGSALTLNAPPVAALEYLEHTLPAAAIHLAGYAPEDMAYLRHRPHRRVWRLYLDGIELPMSSFQLRLRPSENSYFSAVVPKAPSYAGIIAAHASGTLKIYQGYLYDDGGEDLTLIATATLEGIDDTRGPHSKSVTLSGYGPGAPPGPPVEISALEYRQSGGGKIRWRCAPTPQLRPGGVAVDPVSGERITAGLITWAVGMAGARPCVLMEVSGG